MTDTEKQELYTLMTQWSRNVDLQFKKVVVFVESAERRATERMRKACIRECEKVRDSAVAPIEPCTEDLIAQRICALPWAQEIYGKTQ